MNDIIKYDLYRSVEVIRALRYNSLLVLSYKIHSVCQIISTLATEENVGNV